MLKKLSASALTLTLLASGMSAVSAAPTTTNEDMTRGEFVKAVIDALGVEVGTGQTVKFQDVPILLNRILKKRWN